jgi:hypothetical protein
VKHYMPDIDILDRSSKLLKGNPLGDPHLP